MKSFRTLDGFRMDLLAAEPLVTDPVAMEYDENGRAYVVEMTDYPYTDKTTDKPFVERTTDLPIGRVRILEDTDGDGRFDRSTIFADGLSWPTGIALWKGGAFVAATPDIWYLKDTDGDGRADVRRKVYTGFRKFNVQAVMNNLKWGPDHWIYGAGGSNGGEIRAAGRPDAKPVVLGRNDFRFNPIGEQFELTAGGARFGNTFDDWGNRFICNIRNPVQHIVLPLPYLARNPHLPVPSAIHDAAEAGDTLPVFRSSSPEPWRVINAQRLARDRTKASPRSESVATGFFTSATGITIYRGSAYPAKYYGNVFVGEVAGNLIHRQTLTPDGVTFVAKRADANTEFVTSTDNWFRPVNFVNAPDGTLHVLDMYRETIEHPWSIPDDIKAHLDLESGRDRGRIYRLTPPGFRRPAPPRLGDATTERLVAELENPNGWWRETAHRLLFERQDPAAVPLLRKLLRESRNDLARGHALWSLDGLGAVGWVKSAKTHQRGHALESLDGLGALEVDDILIALADRAAGLRESALRLAEPRLGQSPELRRKVLALADDPAVRVRFQAAFSLGMLDDPTVVERLGRIARRDAADLWVRTAVLSSASRCAGPLLTELLGDGDFCAGESSAPLFRELAALVGTQNQPAELAAVLAKASAGPQTADATLPAIVIGLADGLKRSNKSLNDLLRGLPSESARAVTKVLASADGTARNNDAPIAQRLQAIQLLGIGDFAQAKDALTALLDIRQPQTIQIAAVRATSGFRDSGISGILLRPYRSLTPAVRGEVVEALLARSERIPALLDAVEAATVPAADIPLSRRALLLNHSNTAVRDRAAALFANDAPSPRQKVIAEYKAALSLAADRQRGEKVLVRECLTCHRQGERGHEVGPNLETIRHWSPEQLLTNILDPNREVAPQYLEYVVALDDGRIITGMIASETPTSITLRRAERVDETVLRSNITEIATSGKSLMPEGLEKKLTVQETADLLAILLAP